MYFGREESSFGVFRLPFLSYFKSLVLLLSRDTLNYIKIPFTAPTLAQCLPNWGCRGCRAHVLRRRGSSRNWRGCCRGDLPRAGCHSGCYGMSSGSRFRRGCDHGWRWIIFSIQNCRVGWCGRCRGRCCTSYRCRCRQCRFRVPWDRRCGRCTWFFRRRCRCRYRCCFRRRCGNIRQVRLRTIRLPHLLPVVPLLDGFRPGLRGPRGRRVQEPGGDAPGRLRGVAHPRPD